MRAVNWSELREEFRRTRCTLAELAARHGVPRSTVEKHSASEKWRSELVDYQEITRRAKEDGILEAAIAKGQAEAASVAEWAARREEVRLNEWTVAKDLLRFARDQLTKLEASRTIAKLGDIARAAEIASKLARLAAQLPTEIADIQHEHEHRWQAVGRMGVLMAQIHSPTPNGVSPKIGPTVENGSTGQ